MYICTSTNSILIKNRTHKHIECIYTLNSDCIFVHCTIKRSIQTIYGFRVESELNQGKHMHILTLNSMHVYLCMYM